VAPFGFRGYNGRVRAAALAVALGLVVVTNAAAAPKPHVERARAGAVEAVFSYSYDAAAFRFSRQRLTITRDGVNAFSAKLRKPPAGGFNAQPSGYFTHKRSVFVTDVDGDGEPEVVLDLYWGGAHCCWYSQIYRYVPATKHYTALVRVWGNFGYVFADLDHDGTQELVTRDVSILQADQPVTDFGGFRVVRHHDDRQLAFARGLANQPQHLGAGLRIEVTGGLVGEEQRGLRQQRARDGDTLHFAA